MDVVASSYATCDPCLVLSIRNLVVGDISKMPLRVKSPPRGCQSLPLTIAPTIATQTCPSIRGSCPSGASLLVGCFFFFRVASMCTKTPQFISRGFSYNVLDIMDFTISAGIALLFEEGCSANMTGQHIRGRALPAVKSIQIFHYVREGVSFLGPTLRPIDIKPAGGTASAMATRFPHRWEGTSLTAQLVMKRHSLSQRKKWLLLAGNMA